jgi:hypothetical protein
VVKSVEGIVEIEMFFENLENGERIDAIDDARPADRRA